MKIEIMFPDGFTLKQEKIAGGIRITISKPTQKIAGTKTNKTKPVAKKVAVAKKMPDAGRRSPGPRKYDRPVASKATKGKAKAKKKTGSTGPRVTA